MDPLQELIRQGILGLVLVLIVTGWLIPKPAMQQVLDRLAKENEIKDQIIARQSAIIERWAEQAQKP